MSAAAAETNWPGGVNTITQPGEIWRADDLQSNETRLRLEQSIDFQFRQLFCLLNEATDGGDSRYSHSAVTLWQESRLRMKWRNRQDWDFVLLKTILHRLPSPCFIISPLSDDLICRGFRFCFFFLCCRLIMSGFVRSWPWWCPKSVPPPSFPSSSQAN